MEVDGDQARAAPSATPSAHLPLHVGVCLFNRQAISPHSMQ